MKLSKILFILCLCLIAAGVGATVLIKWRGFTRLLERHGASRKA